jgi:hypothetical protein
MNGQISLQFAVLSLLPFLLSLILTYFCSYPHKRITIFALFRQLRNEKEKRHPAGVPNRRKAKSKQRTGREERREAKKE